MSPFPVARNCDSPNGLGSASNRGGSGSAFWIGCASAMRHDWFLCDHPADYPPLTAASRSSTADTEPISAHAPLHRLSALAAKLGSPLSRICRATAVRVHKIGGPIVFAFQRHAFRRRQSIIEIIRFIKDHWWRLRKRDARPLHRIPKWQAPFTPAGHPGVFTWGSVHLRFPLC